MSGKDLNRLNEEKLRREQTKRRIEEEAQRRLREQQERQKNQGDKGRQYGRPTYERPDEDD